MGMSIDKLNAECRYCYREVDASGLEGFRCTNKTVNMETSWCRPKNANEPCSICEYCKPREEMGMTREEAIQTLNASEYFWLRPTDKEREALSMAVKSLENEQPTVATRNEQSEIVITAKVWDELPVDIKARMITNLKSALTITGYAQS